MGLAKVKILFKFFTYLKRNKEKNFKKVLSKKNMKKSNNS